MGKPRKLNISLDKRDVALLEKQARRHGGNLSATVADGIHLLEEEHRRQALVRWLGKVGEATPKQRQAIIDEWLALKPRRR